MSKRKRIALIVLVSIIALSAWATFRAHPSQIVLLGVVDADEVVVTPPVQARLDSLYVEEGSEVKAGQPIASVLPSLAGIMSGDVLAFDADRRVADRPAGAPLGPAFDPPAVER